VERKATFTVFGRKSMPGGGSTMERALRLPWTEREMVRAEGQMPVLNFSM